MQWWLSEFANNTWELLGEADKPSKHFAIRFKGGGKAGQRGAERALSLLRSDDGWEQLWSRDCGGRDVQIFAGPDKSRRQVRLEVATKKHTQTCADSFPDKTWRSNRAAGIVKCNGLEVVSLCVANQHMPPAYKYKYANLKEVGVRREELEAIFSSLEKSRDSTDDDQWCP